MIVREREEPYGEMGGSAQRGMLQMKLAKAIDAVTSAGRFDTYGVGLYRGRIRGGIER